MKRVTRYVCDYLGSPSSVTMPPILSLCFIQTIAAHLWTAHMTVRQDQPVLSFTCFQNKLLFYNHKLHTKTKNDITHWKVISVRVPLSLGL